MKPSQVLRNAARRVERGINWGGCSAIGDARASLNTRDVARRYFDNVKPRRVPESGYWWCVYSTDGRNARVVGLCLAAAIAAGEGK